MVIPKHHRERVYAKCNGRCGYCGVEITYRQMQVDHVHPQFLAHLRPSEFIHGVENLMPACARCNLWKSTFSLEDFRREIAAQTRRLQERSSNYRMALSFGLIQETGVGVRFYFEAGSQ